MASLNLYFEWRKTVRIPRLNLDMSPAVLHLYCENGFSLWAVKRLQTQTPQCLQSAGRSPRNYTHGARFHKPLRFSWGLDSRGHHKETCGSEPSMTLNPLE